MPKYYVLSMRKILTFPAQGCLNEFEDVLLESCRATLITPRPRNPKRKRKSLRNPFEAPYAVEMPPLEGPSTERVLIVVTISMSYVPGLLDSITKLRPLFDRVVVYIFEAYIPGWDIEREGIRDKIRRYTEFYKNNMDMVFVSMSLGVPTLSKIYGVPVVFVAGACDVLRFGNRRTDRMIDVNAYGRQDAELSQRIARRFNEPASDRFYFHTGDTSTLPVKNWADQRNLFWKMLTQSRIGLAYDPYLVNTNQFPYSFIALRWFEMITAGCLIAGRRPGCPEMDELFSWEDSTVELPEDPDEVIEALEELLNDPDRLHAATRRNYEQSIAHHDWRHRIADMLDHLGLPHPEPLREGLERLADRAAAGVPPG